MYGTWSGLSFGIVIAGLLLVIALAFLASPLIAVIVAALATPFLFLVMSRMRRRTEAEDDAAQARPRASEEAGRPATAEGSTQSPTGSRSTGAPVSGEG